MADEITDGLIELEHVLLSEKETYLQTICCWGSMFAFFVRVQNVPSDEQTMTIEMSTGKIK